MDNISLFIQLYDKLKRLTKEEKCSWEIASEINCYYLQFASTIIRIGEKKDNNGNYIYTFQLFKNNVLVVNRIVKSDNYTEFGLLSELFNTVSSYYNRKLSEVINIINDELNNL